MTAPAQPVRVLMVCTGNICRSPTAEAVLRSMAERAGWGGRLLVDSAGTTAYHVGEAPDARSQRHARRRGYDLSAQRARAVVREDFDRFDHLLAMDRGHSQALQRLAPPAAVGKVQRLLDFATQQPVRDVPDPYDGGEEDFERVLDLVEMGCAGFLKQLERVGGPPQGTFRT